MKNIIFILILITATFKGFSQHTLTITVTNISSAKGVVSAAIYDSETSFLKFDEVFLSGTSKAEKGNAKVIISNVPSGTYAVAIFHDENSNNQLDTNFFGIPKEPVAFSNATMRFFGPPKFEDCAFTLEDSDNITIALP